MLEEDEISDQEEIWKKKGPSSISSDESDFDSSRFEINVQTLLHLFFRLQRIGFLLISISFWPEILELLLTNNSKWASPVMAAHAPPSSNPTC